MACRPIHVAAPLGHRATREGKPSRPLWIMPRGGNAVGTRTLTPFASLATDSAAALHRGAASLSRFLRFGQLVGPDAESRSQPANRLAERCSLAALNALEGELVEPREVRQFVLGQIALEAQ